MNSLVVRFGAMATIIGATLWIFSEGIEVTSGGFTTASLTVLVAAMVGLTAGIWGLYAAQASSGGRLSLVGAICLSAGTALQVIFNFPVIGSLARTEAEVIAQAGWMYPVSSILLVIGTLTFCGVIIRTGAYPRWTGAGAIAALLGLFLSVLFQLPAVSLSAANIVLSLALMAMGYYAWSERTSLRNE